jgi:hypothetical protein
MNALYDYGYKLGLEGYPWKKSPPGFEGAYLLAEPPAEAAAPAEAPQ